MGFTLPKNLSRIYSPKKTEQDLFTPKIRMGFTIPKNPSGIYSLKKSQQDLFPKNLSGIYSPPQKKITADFALPTNPTGICSPQKTEQDLVPKKSQQERRHMESHLYPAPGKRKEGKRFLDLFVPPGARAGPGQPQELPRAVLGFIYPPKSALCAGSFV